MSERRKILLTNDDGIDAIGLVKLARVAVRLGEVTVIAPDRQCSAMSHMINLSDRIYARKVPYPVEGVEAWALGGSPADCVRVGIRNICMDMPDVIISGINNGYNCGSDIQYSGTAAAALEGASSGIHSIAVSEGARGGHEVTEAYLEKILTELIDRPLGFNQIWNVNFPECRLEDFKGILEDRKVSHNSFYIDRYSEKKSEDGTRVFMVDGLYREDAPEGTDFRAVVDGYVSVGIVNNVG